MELIVLMMKSTNWPESLSEGNNANDRTGYSARGPTPAEIPYTLVEIRGRNLEILVFGNPIFPLNLDL